MEIEKTLEKLNTMANEPQTIDFVVKDDFVKNLPQILSNVKELCSWARQQTEADRNLILATDEDFESAKKRCADINKVIRNIEDKRKQVKKEYVKPYEIFEKELKEATTILTTAKDNLWSQVLKAEQEIKDETGKKLKNYYETKASENGILQYREWEQIFDSRWLNKGKKINTACEEIDGIIKQVKNEVLAIRSLKSEFESVLLVRYADGYSMANIITYESRLKAEKQAVEQRKQESQESVQPTTETTIVEPKEAVKNEIDETDEIFTTDFRVWTTKQQLIDLGKYLRENGIKYGKVE